MDLRRLRPHDASVVHILLHRQVVHHRRVHTLGRTRRRREWRPVFQRVPLPVLASRSSRAVTDSRLDCDRLPGHALPRRPAHGPTLRVWISAAERQWDRQTAAPGRSGSVGRTVGQLGIVRVLEDLARGLLLGHECARAAQQVQAGGSRASGPAIGRNARQR